ncbi:hypothetical protein BN961_00303 [Afipia felis]|uniref:SGNH hydrolase-type esterase domain-containing protein n=1 Tax=Afipia felis TaxID=1035 RepID=A0A090MMP3_AFIFE|nr:SGNH family hydrolase [Afipia felis]CEG06924.1 hypothetical protein BN961_00303 [Afipia felis]
MRHWWRYIRRESAGLAVFAVAGLLAFAMAAPASAQLFDFGFGRSRPVPPREVPRGGGGFFPSFRDGFFGDRAPAPQPQQPRVDYSHPPAPEKRDTVAEQNVLVIGDAMADWLAYGLEDALAETPELGVIRKAKTVSGLIRYQPKGEPSDWAAAAKEILASEHPDVIVVMLGLHDRIPIHEKVEKTDKDKKKGKKGAKEKDGKPDANKADASKPGEAEAAPPDTASSDDEEDAAPPERTAPAANGIANFRDPRWVELYNRKIEELIGILKAKGVPVLWVGLPAVRGTKSTSDMLFLDALYRDAAGKAGITYVDVWDGFVDDAGRYLQQGPDFEGQIRRLRSYDGVFFTKAGARKLAHYTEREIRRVLAARSSPLSLPSEAPYNSVNVKPGVAGPRPMAGPVVPLVASSVSADQLLGGVGSRPAAVDALAARTLVKGEPLSPPAGRADDFSWPRHEIGKLEAPPTPAGSVATLDGEKPAAPKPKKRAPQATSNNGFFDPSRPQQQRPRTIAPSAASSGFFFFR